MQQAEGVETEVSWPQEEQHRVSSFARLNAKFQEFHDELDRKKVFENLKKLLVCATLEAEKASSAAISLGQRYEARVRHLEELLRTSQRERDEARDECMHLRERLLAQTTNPAAGTGEQCKAAEDKPLPQLQQQQRQQQQAHSGGCGLQRSSLPALSGRSVERVTPSIQLEVHPKGKKLNELRQPSLQNPQDSENLHPSQARPIQSPVRIELQINSPDAQSSLTSSLQIDVRSSDDQHSFGIAPQQQQLQISESQEMATSSHGFLQAPQLTIDLQPTIKLQPSMDMQPVEFGEHLHQPRDSGPQHHHQPKHGHQQLHQQEQQGHLHHQQQQEPHLNVHLQDLSDPHLHGHSSYDSCSNFHVPSFSSTTPSSGDILAGLGFNSESVSSSSLLQQQQSAHLPEPPEADIQVMLNSLPEKGQLLQAVMQAGPLLQTLMLAGPLPRWRHPPPAVATVEIPKVAMPSVVSSMEKSRGSGSFSTSYGKSG